MSNMMELRELEQQHKLICKKCRRELIICKNKKCWFQRCKGFVHLDGGYHCCDKMNFVAVPREP